MSYSNTDSTLDSTIHSQSSTASSVSFGIIEIREHAMVLGDNPSTSSGPSVELDWTTQSTFTIDSIEQYESMKPERRKMYQLAMPSDFRTKLLIESGYSLREIRRTVDGRKPRRQKTGLSKKVSKLFSRWRSGTVATKRWGNKMIQKYIKIYYNC